MSDMSKKARSAMRAKANRMAGSDIENGKNDPHKKVDGSSWEPNESLNTTRKAGARPIRSRIYKAGGRIQGDRGPQRADKLARGGKAGGGSAGPYSIHDTVDENKSKLGSFHEGGYKKGGHAKRHKRDMGGMTDPRDTAGQALAAGAARSGVPQGRFQVASSGKSPYLRDGGSAKAKRYCAGGRAAGGKTSYSEDAAKDEYMRTQTLKGVPALGQKSMKRHEPESPESKELRKPRKAGGRARGKTNINIIIGKGGNEQPQMPTQGPVKPPMPMPPPPPPQMPPPGMPPGGPPPGAMAGPPPGGPPGGPPMPRKRGGRTYKDMDAGAASGVGRLEKTDIQRHVR